MPVAFYWTKGLCKVRECYFKEGSLLRLNFKLNK